jgi:Zn-dependent protease with chaperone function
MDFFGAQEIALRRSRRLVLLFGTAVACIVLVVYIVVRLAMLGPMHPDLFRIDLGVLGWVAAATVGLIACGSWYRIRGLRRGGAVLAAAMGGRRVLPNTADPDERRLVNVVEEMAIASGTPVPAIYVLPSEEAMNAFAAGYTIHDAAVAVTGGTLRGMSRDELQGVVAHEFSHILNGDMRLNIRLVGLLHGILLLAMLGRGMIRGSDGRSRRGNQTALVGVAFLAIGYIGLFFGKLIRAAISREREFLADAAAVQFTRNPDALAGALKKTGITPARVEHPRAEEASHLFFAQLRSHWFGLLATHPPLDDRIRRLDPSWNGWLIAPDSRRSTLARGSAPATSAFAADPPAARSRPQAGGGKAADSRAPDGTIAGAALLASIGTPRPEHLGFAAELLRRIPDSLRDAAHSPDGARELVLALFLASEDAEGSLAQTEAVLEAAGEARDRVASHAAAVAALGPEARIPLLDLALPALRLLPEHDARSFVGQVLRAIRADGRVHMFEFTLAHVLSRNLSFGKASGGAPGREIHSFVPVQRALQVVLSGLAHAGAESDVEARAALAKAAARLPTSAGKLRLRGRDAAGLPAVDEALQSMARTSFGVRHRFLEACVESVAHDGRVVAREAEMLRAIAEAIGCPVPPALAAWAAGWSDPAADDLPTTTTSSH